MPLTISRLLTAAIVAPASLAVAYFLLFDVFGAPARDFFVSLGDPRAQLQKAEVALSPERDQGREARDLAADALLADPLARDGHKILAQALAVEGAKSEASALWRAAARFARDGEAQAVMLQQAVDDRDFKGFAARLDVMLRGQEAGRWTPLSQAVVPVLSFPEAIDPLADRLDDMPPWRQAFLNAAAARGQDFAAMRALFISLQERPSGLSDDEARPLLERFVAEGRFEEAYALFISRLPPRRLEAMGHLYNADFQYAVTNLPFDWVFTRTREALIDVRRPRGANLPSVLRIDFFGSRVQFRHVSHLLALPPGAWRFSGYEQAVALENARGLRWRIACAHAPRDSIGESPLLSGNVDWRPFAVDFEVPPDCPFQRLELELPGRVALEFEVSGAVAFMELSMSPRLQRSNLQ